MILFEPKPGWLDRACTEAHKRIQERPEHLRSDDYEPPGAIGASGSLGIQPGGPSATRLAEAERGGEEDWPEVWMRLVEPGKTVHCDPRCAPQSDVRRYVLATSQDSSGLRTAYEKALKKGNADAS